MSAKESGGVKVLNGALEEASDGSIILRGTVAMESLQNLLVDDYQREVLATSGSGGRKTSKIRKGIEAGNRLPDIELGMRGQSFTSHGKTFVLNDPIYIVDGLQRVSAMVEYLEAHEGKPNGALPIGAQVHFKTDKKWERQRFSDLNGLRTPVSPNVMLRNLRSEHTSIKALYQLSMEDENFPLYKRVTWSQRQKRAAGELITASSLIRAAIFIHRHIIDETSINPSRVQMKGGAGEKAARLPAVLDRVVNTIGAVQFKKNVSDFFTLIDKCWGIRTIQFGEAQGHLRGNFLAILGGFISRNPELWDDKRRSIKIDNATFEKIKKFPVDDPEIRRLCAAGTMVLPTLSMYLLNHMNKKRRNKFK